MEANEPPLDFPLTCKRSCSFRVYVFNARVQSPLVRAARMNPGDERHEWEGGAHGIVRGCDLNALLEKKTRSLTC
jgi:hypothetical protein